MYYQTSDNNDLYRTFWEEEATNFPQWFMDSTNSKKVTWQEFKDFCAKMWRVYSVDDKALVYFERQGKQANVHFSLLRKAKINTEDLINIRDEALCDINLIYAWVFVKNKGLARMLESIGFEWHGFTMMYGTSHNKPMEYRCMTYIRKRVVCEPTSLLQSQ